MEIQEYLSYKDVSLLPNFSKAWSRKDCSTKVNFCGREFLNPVIPANMSCVIDVDMARSLDSNGYFYILHRFYDYDYIFEWVKGNQDLNCVSISIGVNPEKDHLLLERISGSHLRVDFITIDVANAHNVRVLGTIEEIKSCFNSYFHPKIIVGNICTKEAVEDLALLGIDAVKVGLSCGASCTTYNNTGVGSPMFSTILDVVPVAKKLGVQVIADGGIREFGDVCKALVAGADMVMVGSMIAACVDSPAKTVIRTEDEQDDEGREWYRDSKFKEFFGSASQYQKNSGTFVEGRKVFLRCNGFSVLEFYKKAEEAIQSSISYAGGFVIKDLTDMKFVKINS